MSITTNTTTSQMTPLTFVDRRSPASTGQPPGFERRQFGDGHRDLSPDAAELGCAIDQYKLINRRRFISYEEMLSIIIGLGYKKHSADTQRR